MESYRARVSTRSTNRCEAGTHGPGQDGAYRNIPGVVLAERMNEAFSIARSTGGDVLHGAAGDWLMRANDYGIVQQARFAEVYRPASGNALKRQSPPLCSAWLPPA
ncbi:PGDYG domain-containing protein [Cupriavidus basilensis]